MSGKHHRPPLPIEAKILAWGGVIVGVVWFYDQIAHL